jgi:ribosomal-protein-alanine N-acetyltransferase
VKTSRATADHWPEIERFLRRARHVYADAGREDLLGLIRSNVAIVGRDDDKSQEPICAILVFQRESRPSMLPTSAPDREILRYAALAPGRSSITDLPLLMDEVWPWLAVQGPHFQVQAYGSQHWIVKPLLASGFEIDERIEFLRLTRLQQRSDSRMIAEGSVASSVDDLVIRPVSPDDLALLAELDAAAFPPRWHFGDSDLFTLLLGGTMHLVLVDDRLVGYWAQTLAADREAHLARLAVHPELHGRGVGRFLLADAIEFARSEKLRSILLNTQTDNQRALKLYRSFGFRPTGRIVPILTRMSNDMDSEGSIRAKVR